MGVDYLMEVVDTTQINSFAPIAAQTDFESPSEESVFVLTSSQLQEIISQAVQKAIEPLAERISSLEVTVAAQEEKIAALRAQVRSLEGIEEQDVTRICLDIAQDRQRISKLEKRSEPQPQPLQKDRADILRALLAANGGKMLAKDARQKMHLSRSAFSQLIATMKDDIELKQFHLKKNQKVIILKSCLAKQ